MIYRLLCLRAIQAGHAGNWKEATAACRDLFQVSNLLTRNAGCFTHYLIGISFIDGGLEQSRKLVRLPDMPADALRDLSEALAEIDPLDRGLIPAIKAEYFLEANEIDAITKGKSVPENHDAKDSPRIRPGYRFQPNRTKALLADVFRDMIRNAPLPENERGFRTLELFEPLENGEVPPASLNSFGKTLVAMMLPGQSNILDAASCHEGDVAATRLIVACRRYEKEHGELPPTLDALVPKYIDAVPRDPFDGKPMRYVCDRAIVYSVGKDLIDQGGAKPPTDNSSNEKADRWEAKDAVFEIGSREK